MGPIPPSRVRSSGVMGSWTWTRRTWEAHWPREGACMVQRLGQISTSLTTKTPLGERTEVATVTAPTASCQGLHRAQLPRTLRPSPPRCPNDPPPCAKRHCNSALVRSRLLPSRSPTPTWRWSFLHLDMYFPILDTECLSKTSSRRWLVIVRSPRKEVCRVRLCTSCLSKTVDRIMPAASLFINPILSHGQSPSHLRTRP